MTAQRKSFKDQMSPAVQFISRPALEDREEESPTSTGEADIPPGYHRDPALIENKSRRVPLLLKPSLYTKLKARAEASGCSLNAYIHSILQASVDEKSNNDIKI